MHSKLFLILALTVEKRSTIFIVFFLPKISNLSETLRLSLISSHFSSPSSTFKAFHCMLSSQVGRLQRHEGRVSYFIYDQFPPFTGKLCHQSRQRLSMVRLNYTSSLKLFRLSAPLLPLSCPHPANQTKALDFNLVFGQKAYCLPDIIIYGDSACFYQRRTKANG